MSSFSFSENEQEEPIHIKIDSPAIQTLGRLSEIQPAQKKVEITLNNSDPGYSFSQKVNSVMKSYEIGKWPGMTWSDQKDIEEKYKRSLVEIELLESKANTSQKLIESYKKSCFSLQETLDKKEKELQKLKIPSLKIKKVQEEINTQTEGLGVSKSAYAEVFYPQL